MIREMVMKAGDGMKKTVRIWHTMKMRHTALTALALMLMQKTDGAGHFCITRQLMA
jgi:hypothetical protein